MISTDPDCEIIDGRKVCADSYLDVGVEEIIKHPKYNVGKSLVNDIALIRLNQTIVFTGIT